MNKGYRLIEAENGVPIKAWTKGVAIESEVSWPNGGHSIYIRDPAGNSLEFATPDIWEVS